MSPALLEGGGVYEAHPVLLLAAMALTLAVASGVALAVNEIDTNGPDTLRGTNGDDNLSRNGANDVLWGGGGKDNLLGGTGNDIVLSGNEHRFFSRGDQNLVGGSGNDTVIGGLHKAGPSTSS
jgi:Ca2+-binding RTX toxin-like protein